VQTKAKKEPRHRKGRKALVEDEAEEGEGDESDGQSDESEKSESEVAAKRARTGRKGEIKESNDESEQTKPASTVAVKQQVRISPDTNDCDITTPLIGKARAGGAGEAGEAGEAEAGGRKFLMLVINLFLLFLVCQ
jgi:hypothetical protein